MRFFKISQTDTGLEKCTGSSELSSFVFYEGLVSRDKKRRQFWNAIPEWEKERVVEVARKYPEKSCREIAWHITDEMGYFISESSVYRILKAKNLVTSPVYTVISAKDKFEQPTTRINELWQTDFSAP